MFNKNIKTTIIIAMLLMVSLGSLVLNADSDVGFYPSICDLKHLTGNHWNWVSFPRLPRDGNKSLNICPLLEDMIPFPDAMEMMYGGYPALQYTYQFDFIKFSRDDAPLVFENFPSLDLRYDSWCLYDHNAGGRASTVKWQSMPALDTVTTNGDMACNVLAEIMGNGSNPIVTLDNVFWNELVTFDDYQIWLDDDEWENDTETLMSIQGYKFKVKSNLLYSVYLNIIGHQIPEDTQIPLKAGHENWTGYFMEDTREWDEAFGTSIDNIYSIQTQYWTRQREMPKPGSPWKAVINGDYTLSRGDMVIVKCFNDEDFTWFDGNIVLPLTVPRSTVFSFEEELDYLPVYVEFDTGDIPTEVAVMANGVCQGAAVVEDGAAEICAYITNNGGENLELELYYGERAEAKTIKDLKVYDAYTGNFISKEITINPNEDYYHISLRENQESVEQAPDGISLSNYPNPFNPTTNISYSLPVDSSVELNIFNIKGQLVKHLAKGKLPAGDYNISWNGVDDNGSRVGSGIYFYRLTTDKEVVNKKMILLK